MDQSDANLPTSYLLGSVPAVITEEKNTTKHAAPSADLQTFPPTNVGRGYQTVSSTSEAFEQQPENNWKGYFSVSSYTQYFNVDTDVVFNRLMSTVNPLSGDFFSKIDANPDLYGLIWISTTLVFVLASLGNIATFLIQKRTNGSTSWTFNVSYVNVAAGSVYGYAILVPLAYYFLLQYMGTSASLIRFWCMWGYSFTIFVPATFLLLVPVEFLRWIVIITSGGASASFVALNLKSYVDSNDLFVLVVAAFCLQIALAIFLKVWFFT